jgi:hypothetical protein
MRRNKSSGNSIRNCGKAIGPVASRIRGPGKRTVNHTAIRRRNDGSRSTKPSPRKFPPCACGGTRFAVVGSDGMEHVALKCRSCGEDRVLRVRGRKVTVLRKLD